MNRFCLITNYGKSENEQMIQHIVRYLEQRGKSCQVMENDRYDIGGIRHFTNISKISTDMDCAIVLGGDGTMIQAAIDLVHQELPILGVNTGTLGFLTETDCQNIDTALDKLMQGDYTIERRIMLKETQKFPGENSRTSCYALNDMVVSKSGDCRLITIKVYLNQELVDIYRADGLIVSTPTGSTGYNLSAGGPVLVPGLQATVVTPICPHSLNKRSLLLDAQDQIMLEIGRTKERADDQAVFIADGRTVGNLRTGDRLLIQVPHATTELIKLSGISFYERMREKLNGN